VELNSHYNDEKAHMSRTNSPGKFKMLQHQIEQLKEEIREKDDALSAEIAELDQYCSFLFHRYE
jgi:peptidoglycan hydrolase CwlO-like protein